MKKPKRFNSVSVTLALLFAAFVYAVWAFVPVMWPLWRMSGIMRTACAQAYSEPDNRVVLQGLLTSAARTKLRVSEDNFIIDRIGYSDEELREAPEGWRSRMATTGKECVIAFRYVDRYTLPVVGLEYTLPYESSVSLDLRRDEEGSNALYELFYNSCTCTSVPRRS